MSGGAWYEYNPDVIDQAAEDNTSAVLPAVTPSEIESVTASTIIKPIIISELQAPLHALHPLHQENDTVEMQALPTHCQARKIQPARICGAPLKEGNNGFLSCSDMACQVPYKRSQL
jgi:hypothetical protein